MEKFFVLTFPLNFTPTFNRVEKVFLNPKMSHSEV